MLQEPRRPAGGARDGDRRGRRRQRDRRGGRLRRAWRQGRRGDGVGLWRGRCGRRQGEGAADGRGRAQGRHAHRRPQFARACQFRHRRDRKLLHHVHGYGPRRGARRDAEPERRALDRAGRIPAPARHRRPPYPRHRQRCRHYRRRTGGRGGRGSGSQAVAALSREHPRDEISGGTRRRRARPRPADHRVEIRPLGSRAPGGAVAHRRTGQRRPRGRCLLRAARHLARAGYARSGRSHRALSQGLEAEGQAARGHQQFGRGLRHDRGRGDRGRHADGETVG